MIARAPDSMISVMKNQSSHRRPFMVGAYTKKKSMARFKTRTHHFRWQISFSSTIRHRATSRNTKNEQNKNKKKTTKKNWVDIVWEQLVWLVHWHTLTKTVYNSCTHCMQVHSLMIIIIIIDFVLYCGHKCAVFVFCAPSTYTSELIEWQLKCIIHTAN